MSETTYLMIIIGSYFLGSIPFGLLFTRAAGKGDIRTQGSGNIGATNVLRSGGKGLALITLIADCLKGILPTYAAGYFLNNEAAALAAFAAVAGHIFPVWLKFKGGKGVATALGVFTILSWKVGVICLFIWIGMVYLTRYSSIASLFAAGFAPLFALKMAPSETLLAMGGITLLIYIRHLGNISRLLKGDEPQIFTSK